MHSIIAIPALNPDIRLVDMVRELTQGGATVVVVNDGSRQEADAVFQQLEAVNGCTVLHHDANAGKGAALKTAVQYIRDSYPDSAGIVTADADLQHSVRDILRVARALEETPCTLILGMRDFSTAGVPWKSRWGNRITSAVFKISTGITCPDTQTGLRGIPPELAECALLTPGNRFEYEMNFLLEAARRKYPMRYVPIQTIYLEGNRSSHFHPVLDAVRIYWNLLKFALSSLASSVVDLGAFTLLSTFLLGQSASGLLAATVLARLLSGGVNFLINRNWVFARQKRHGSAPKYAALFVGQMLASWLLVTVLSMLPIHVTLVKILVDGGLFFLSYHIQKRYVFPDTNRFATGGTR